MLFPHEIVHGDAQEQPRDGPGVGKRRFTCVPRTAYKCSVKRAIGLVELTMKINRLTVFPLEIADGGGQFSTLQPQTPRPQTLNWQTLRTKWHMEREREFFIDNLLVRIHFIIVRIRWTGLAPWAFEFPVPGSLTSTFLKWQMEMLKNNPEMARQMAEKVRFAFAVSSLLSLQVLEGP